MAYSMTVDVKHDLTSGAAWALVADLRRHKNTPTAEPTLNASHSYSGRAYLTTAYSCGLRTLHTSKCADFISCVCHRPAKCPPPMVIDLINGLYSKHVSKTSKRTCALPRPTYVALWTRSVTHSGRTSADNVVNTQYMGTCSSTCAPSHSGLDATASGTGTSKHAQAQASTRRANAHPRSLDHARSLYSASGSDSVGTSAASAVASPASP